MCNIIPFVFPGAINRRGQGNDLKLISSRLCPSLHFRFTEKFVCFPIPAAIQFRFSPPLAFINILQVQPRLEQCRGWVLKTYGKATSLLHQSNPQTSMTPSSRQFCSCLAVSPPHAMSPCLQAVRHNRINRPSHGQDTLHTRFSLPTSRPP